MGFTSTFWRHWIDGKVFRSFASKKMPKGFVALYLTTLSGDNSSTFAASVDIFPLRFLIHEFSPKQKPSSSTRLSPMPLKKNQTDR